MKDRAKTKTSTPDRILDAAQHLILLQGYHGVSVDSIIELSGVSKGTFFYHFKSKEALAKALFTRFFEAKGVMVRSTWEKVDKEDLSQLEKLITFIGELAPAYRRDTSSPGCLIASFSYQLANEMPELREMCRSIVAGWEDFFSPLFRNALNCSENEASELARMMFCLLEGSFIVERVEQSKALESQFQQFRRYVTLLAAETNA